MTLYSARLARKVLSLVDNKHISILLLPEDDLLYQKSLSALEEIKARGGSVLTVSTKTKEQISDYHIEVACTVKYNAIS